MVGVRRVECTRTYLFFGKKGAQSAGKSLLVIPTPEGRVVGGSPSVITIVPVNTVDQLFIQQAQLGLAQHFHLPIIYTLAFAA